MAFILQSNTPSSSTRKLYRDALVNPATRYSFDSKNSYGWDTPNVQPVAGKLLRDLSADDLPMSFEGAGFDDSTTTDGVHFNQGNGGVIEIGNAGALDLGGQNVTGFFLVIWMSRQAGFSTADFQGVGGVSVFNRNNSPFIVDLDQDGTSPVFALGGVGRLGDSDRDLVADEVIQYAFSFETGGGKTVLKKFKNGLLFKLKEIAGDSVILPNTAQKMTLGQAGGGAAAAFRLYRSFLEVTEVSSGASAASGNDIESQVALDFAINKGRFSIA